MVPAEVKSGKFTAAARAVTSGASTVMAFLLRLSFRPGAAARSKTLGVGEVVVLLQGNDSIHHTDTYFNPNIPNISNPNAPTLIDDDMSICIESSDLKSLGYSRWFVGDYANCSSCHILSCVGFLICLSVKGEVEMEAKLELILP